VFKSILIVLKSAPVLYGDNIDAFDLAGELLLKGFESKEVSPKMRRLSKIRGQ